MRRPDHPKPTIEDMGTADSLPAEIPGSVPFQRVPQTNAPSFGPPPSHAGETTRSLPAVEAAGRTQPPTEPPRAPYPTEPAFPQNQRWGREPPAPDRETTAIHSYVAPPDPPEQAPARAPARMASVTVDPRMVAGKPSGLVGGTPFSAPPPAPVPVYHDSRAALGGVSAASDAAAQTAHRPQPASPIRPRISAASSHEYLDLMWFDESAPRRVRDQSAWSDYLRDPPRTGDWVVGDQAEQPQEKIRDERMVRRALARVPVASFDSIDTLLLEAIDEDGVLDRPLCVLNGDLVMTFDLIETLKATVATAGHFAVADKKLKEAVDAATELLAEKPQSGSALIENLTQRVRQVFGGTQRGVSSDYLESTVERMLLEGRQYVRRDVLGGPQILGELIGDSSGGLPTYLGAELTNKLPLFRRFRVRLLCEPHPPQDPTDGSHLALKALAIARIMPRRNRG